MHPQGNFQSGSRKFPLRNFHAHLTLLSGCSRKIRGLQTRLPDRHNHPAARNGPDGMARSPVSRPLRSLSLISVKSIAAGAATKPQERRRLESPRASKWRWHYTHKANATPLAPGKPRRRHRKLLQLAPRIDNSHSQRAAQRQHRMQHIHTSECPKIDRRQRQQEPADHTDHHQDAGRPNQPRPGGMADMPPVQSSFGQYTLETRTPGLSPAPRHPRH